MILRRNISGRSRRLTHHWGRRRRWAPVKISTLLLLMLMLLGITVHHFVTHPKHQQSKNLNPEVRNTESPNPKRTQRAECKTLNPRKPFKIFQVEKIENDKKTRENTKNSKKGKRSCRCLFNSEKEEEETRPECNAEAKRAGRRSRAQQRLQPARERELFGYYKNKIK